jgi:hypothetical protein
VDPQKEIKEKPRRREGKVSVRSREGKKGWSGVKRKRNDDHHYQQKKRSQSLS